MEPLLFSALVIFTLVSVLFGIAAKQRDNSIIDIFYGMLFVAVALISYVFMSTKHPVATLVTLLVVVWGVRLSARIYLKNKNKPEDKRYALWRASWMQKGMSYFLFRSYFQVFLLQGFIVWLVSLPIILVNTAPSMEWNGFVTVGLFVWVFGFLFESVADFQLDSFLRKAENRGNIMQSGLFKFSRRPNYFGESLMWWGVALIAFANPIHWIAFISPAVITYIVVAVTGPITEQLWEGNEAYEVYKKTTSYFIPWFPKKGV